MISVTPGCKSHPEAIDRPPVQPLFAILETLPAQGAINAGDVYLGGVGAVRFAVLDEDAQKTAEISIASESGSEFGGSQARSNGESRVEYIKTDDQGRIVMSAVLDRDENALSEFNPPLLLMPAALSAGSRQSSESAMRVVDAENRSKLREAGRATRSIEYVSDYRVRTPSGEHIAKAIEVKFNADLRLADAQEHSTLFIVPGIGLIAEQSSETVKVFGAFGNTKRRTIVRLE